MNTGHATVRRFCQQKLHHITSNACENPLFRPSGKLFDFTHVTCPFLYPSSFIIQQNRRKTVISGGSRRRCLSSKSELHESSSSGVADEPVLVNESRSVDDKDKNQSRTARAPVSLEDLLSYAEPKTKETKQLIWRAWLGLSEDSQAARIQLLDSLLDMLHTEDPQDARRLRALLDAKFGLIDSKQRPFYSFWAHMMLQESDLAFRYYQSLDLDTQKTHLQTFMRKIVEDGDWATGVKLWHMSRDWSENMHIWHSNRSIRQLLDLVPNLATWQFLQVLPQDEAERFKKYIRPAIVIHLAASGKAEQALQLVRDVPFSSEVIVRDSEIAATIRALTNSGRYYDAIHLYDDVVNSSAKPNVLQRMSLAVLRAATLVSNLEPLRSLLKGGIMTTFTAKTGKIRLVEVYTMVMSAFSRYGQTVEVEELFQEFLDQGHKPDVFMLGTLLHARVMTLEVGNAQEIFTSCQATYDIRPDQVLHNMLLHMYADTLDVEAAQQVMKLSIEMGLKPDIYTASTLIDLYAHRKNAGRAQKVFDEICSLGIIPNVVVYGALMNAYVESDDVGGMQEVLSQFEQANKKPNGYIMNIILKALQKAGRSSKEMLQVIRDMGDAGIRSSDRTHTILMRTYLEEDNIQAAVELLRRIPSPNEFHYTMVMVCYLRANNANAHERVLKYYTEMIDSGVKPSNVSMAVLINACQLRNTPESKGQVRVLLDALMTSNRLDLTSKHAPRTAPMTGIYRLFFRKNKHGIPEIENSNELFKQFLHSTVGPDGTPDIRNLTAIMSTYETTGQVDKVRSLFVAIKKEADRMYRYDPVTTLSPSSSSSSSLSPSAPSSSTKPLIPSSGIPQIAKSARFILVAPLSILMRALSRTGEYLQLERVWKAMQDQGYGFDDLNWNQYVRVQLSQGNIERGLFLISSQLIGAEEDRTEKNGGKGKIHDRTKAVYRNAFKLLQTEGLVVTFNGEEEKAVVWARVLKNYGKIVEVLKEGE